MTTLDILSQLRQAYDDKIFEYGKLYSKLQSSRDKTREITWKYNESERHCERALTVAHDIQSEHSLSYDEREQSYAYAMKCKARHSELKDEYIRTLSNERDARHVFTIVDEEVSQLRNAYVNACAQYVDSLLDEKRIYIGKEERS
uniref:Uncharacterized protein n=1 Tax=viral metagenome TaxID=1070528 RepID=A0A6C0K1K8_9ZZZZ